MKRFSIIAGLLLAATACVAMLSRKQVTTAQQLTVIVDNVGFLGGGRGSGILLDATHILTCAHMVKDPKDEFFIYTYPLKDVYKASVEMIDRRDDVALLVLNRPAIVTAKVTFADAQTGDEITVIGNALGSSEWVVTHGIISGAERGFMLTDAVINPGNSGGPWLNNKGQIVAMTDWTIGPDSDRHARGIAGGVDSQTIQLILKVYRDLQKVHS